MQKVKTERLRDYVGPVTNTDIWDKFQLRPNDVIVCTPPKSGTTWTLNIVMMLIHGKVVPDAGNREDAPWLDCGLRDRKETAAKLNGLTRRRCLKSHTPMDGISYGTEPTYIVVYRHPIDAHFSFRSHVANMRDPGPLAENFAGDIKAGFNRFLDDPLTDTGTDNMSVASIAHHYQQALVRADNGNVHFFHYADLSRDLRGQIARLARILKIDLSPEFLSELAEANTFTSMRKAIEASERRFSEDSPFVDEAQFFASGTSNKWEGRLGDEDIARYHERCASYLSIRDAAWLNWGDRRES